ncbi:GGDEF domain-containing protein [Fictibacillus nanhaiensis]|uniref:GGDEF domain-containing protein n=1 Tax=Fictibacillus nanhaiensis TaxID=742169 RepID=A0ABS2ZP87_9BACL|nr:GGDEF domain-containing protein [Fictibacillus nanhaiensis]
MKSKKNTVQLAEPKPVIESTIHTQMQELYLQIKKLETKLNKMTFYDELTLLPNLKSFKKELTFALINAERSRKKLAVVKIGLDRFKIVNDTLGILNGDALLKEVAVRLQSLGSNSKALSRMNGDEFLIFIEDARNEQDITIFCKEIMGLFKLPFYIDNNELFVSVSIGVSVYPFAGHNVLGLIKTADIAMCRVKEEGKNNYKIYNGMLNKFTGHQLTFENELRHALKRKEFSLVYQPQWSIKTKQLIGIEALIRWNHPHLGLISPSDFIPLAEKLGIIFSVGEWVLEEACKQNKRWQDADFPPLRCSVNISIAQLLHSDFPKIVSNILNRTQLDPQFLELEITESIAIVKEGYILKVLNRFKEMGISIALDDFGTGYSSLKYLSQFPIKRLKIDQTFLHEKSIINESIIRAIITMGHSMNLSVLAEGVENKEQLGFLESEGCDEIQGYYFSKPLPPKEVETLIQYYSPLAKEVE